MDAAPWEEDAGAPACCSAGRLTPSALSLLCCLAGRTEGLAMPCTPCAKSERANLSMHMHMPPAFPLVAYQASDMPQQLCFAAAAWVLSHDAMVCSPCRPQESLQCSSAGRRLLTASSMAARGLAAGCDAATLGRVISTESVDSRPSEKTSSRSHVCISRSI